MNLANTISVIEERVPVWEALSNFFLDRELDKADYQRIAEALASSPYSVGDMEEILRREVYPVLIWNLRSAAGEWAGFDRKWLRGSIEPYLNKRPKFRLPIAQWAIIRHHWQRVSELMESERFHKANKTLFHKSERAVDFNVDF